MDFTPLKYIYRPDGIPDANTLLLLHGTGGNEEDLIPLTSEYGDGFNILSVRGNVLEHGMPRFFRRLGMSIFDEEDLTFRTHELANFLIEVAKKEGFDSSKLIAYGYSNGANIAGALLLLYPVFLKGAILLRPMKPFQVLPQISLKHQSYVFLSSGRTDGTVNIVHVKEFAEYLQEGGYTVESYLVDAGHNLSKEDIALSVAWYTQHFTE
ncbi:alpha/beta hydrolase [Muricauda oceani]|uniref:Alpha/beta hydrolase n=1 Tax=Flagellimonas oceani TaxID=2698672 RepID=A0A6G7IZS6_9FLAO|nr:alpha/beta hydrolase [Allomuricauda oceani]MBW8244799.1 alpha/beta hydrolase [Allomuricauda oceani]QII43889.1 alpha/beta hydrolase [Allomuricauda oceani]